MSSLGHYAGNKPQPHTVEQKKREFTDEDKKKLLDDLLSGSIKPGNDVVDHLLREIVKVQAERKETSINLSRVEQSFRFLQEKMTGYNAILEKYVNDLAEQQSKATKLPVDKSDKH